MNPDTPIRTGDTTPDAAARLRSVYCAMTGGRRLALMFAMSEEARALTLCGLRARHPQWTEAQVVRHERVLRLGETLVASAWGPPT